MRIDYKAIVADPPWWARNQGNRASPSYQRIYEPLRTSQIIDIGGFVPTVCHRDCALFLWAPAFVVLEGDATAVCRGWGFEPKQMIPWVKTTKDNTRPAMGMGNWTRGCAEYFILAIRGRGPEVLDRGVPGEIRAPRRRHSEKPPEGHELVERLFDGPYLEMFARRQRPGWDVWGDQC